MTKKVELLLLNMRNFISFQLIFQILARKILEQDFLMNWITE